MNVAPDDAAHVRMSVDDFEELGRILQAHPIQPAAGHRHRLMVQTHERMPIPCRGKSRLQLAQALRAEPAGSGPGDRAVEQHDAPEAKVDGPPHHERRAVELAAHRLRLVVVAGQTQHRHSQAVEYVPEMDITRWVVLDQIARDQHGVGGPVALARVRERCLERGQSGNATQQLALAAVKVRIGEMCQAH